MKKKKHPFTLLEVIIALSLSAILFSFIFFYLRKTLLLGTHLEKAEKEVYANTYVQERLSQLFTQINPDIELEEETFFYAVSPEEHRPLEFIFFFDNGIDPDPDFCGIVMGKLYLNKKGNFILALASLNKEKKEPPRKEVFFTGIKKVDFTFYDKNKMISSKKEKEPKEEKTWPKEKNALPFMMQFTLHKKNDSPPITWAFFFYPIIDEPLTWK